MTYYQISTVYDKNCERLGKNIETYIKANGGKVFPSPFLLPPVILCEIPDEMIDTIQKEFKGISEIKKGDSKA